MSTELWMEQSLRSFPSFVDIVFCESFDRFIGGKYVDRVTAFYQQERKTMRIAPKDHFKSTCLYALAMWHMFKNPHEDVRLHYFSFEKTMAQYHVSKIREFVSRNPFFRQFTDLKTTAEGVAKYKLPSGATFSISPHGMLSFKRGIHDRLIFVDDPFQDPASKLDPKVVTRVNHIFKTQIMDMVTKGGDLHVVGTPQTTVDFLFDRELQRQMGFMQTPAEVNSAAKQALWPEWMDWDELQKRKAARGEKIFNQEYNCRPAYAEQAFFTRDQLLAVADSGLKNAQAAKEGDVLNRFGGWDIGKKTHPAHFTVLEEGADGVFRQVYQRFFDGVDYNQQLESVKAVSEALAVDKVYYDDTRGELEALKERGDVPGSFRGVTFTLKQKNAMANALGVLVTEKKIRLQPDERQLNQLQVVTNDLDAIETPEGHGDCFWSLAMAAWGFASGPKMVVLDGLDETTNWRGKRYGSFQMPY